MHLLFDLEPSARNICHNVSGLFWQLHLSYLINEAQILQHHYVCVSTSVGHTVGVAGAFYLLLVFSVVK